MKYVIAMAIVMMIANAKAQSVTSPIDKEGFIIAEIGPALSQQVTSGKLIYGFSIAAEVTPIEGWLELEAESA